MSVEDMDSASPSTPHTAAGVHNLCSLLDAMEAQVKTQDGEVAVRQIFGIIGRRAYGPLLLVIGVISISPVTIIPGGTWAFAALTLLVALQLMFHRDAPWMPRSVLNIRVSAAALQGFVRRARPSAQVLDRVVQPRLSFFADPPWVLLVALMCAAAALITFPLGFIPFGPVAPGLAIVLFGLGMTARDGLLLLAGTAAMGASSWFVVAPFL